MEAELIGKIPQLNTEIFLTIFHLNCWSSTLVYRWMVVFMATSYFFWQFFFVRQMLNSIWLVDSLAIDNFAFRWGSLAICNVRWVHASKSVLLVEFIFQSWKLFSFLFRLAIQTVLFKICFDLLQYVATVNWFKTLVSGDQQLDILRSLGLHL